MHILLARKIGKWTRGNRRRVGPFRPERPRERILAAGSYSPAEADKTPPLKPLRGGARVRTSSHATTGARSAVRPGATGLHAVDCGHQRRSRRASCFPNAQLRRRRHENPPTSTTEAVRGANDRIAQAGPSSSIAEAVSRCGQSASNAATGRAAAIDEDNPAGNEFPETASARLWNPPYTPWRADRPAICGGNATVR